MAEKRKNRPVLVNSCVANPWDSGTGTRRVNVFNNLAVFEPPEIFFQKIANFRLYHGHNSNEDSELGIHQG